jgi:small subunit ribosomal protein S18
LADQNVEGSEGKEAPRERSPREDRPQRQQRRYFPRRRVCAFCVEHVKQVDYKDVNVLQRYITDQGKIRGRRQTGNCGRHQRQVSNAIKRARQLALLPYGHEHRFAS